MRVAPHTHAVALARIAKGPRRVFRGAPPCRATRPRSRPRCDAASGGSRQGLSRHRGLTISKQGGQLYEAKFLDGLFRQLAAVLSRLMPPASGHTKSSNAARDFRFLATRACSVELNQADVSLLEMTPSIQLTHHDQSLMSALGYARFQRSCHGYTPAGRSSPLSLLCADRSNDAAQLEVRLGSIP